ncbi:MAG: hypothetical protein GX684_01090 [Ruminococcaceae bacterium]|nr:hypothetical protein [Oscillospiraceae bacterium]
MKNRLTMICLILSLLLVIAAASACGAGSTAPGTKEPPATEKPISETETPKTDMQQTKASNSPIPEAGRIIILEEDTAADKYKEYIEFTADESEFKTKIFLVAEGTVRDFKFLSVAIEGADEGGKIEYTAKTLYEQELLTEEKPLLVTMTFFGDLPSYGISYTGQNGETKVFAIEQSGKDGSVLLTELK